MTLVICNPLKINEWNIKKIVILVLTAQLIIWGTMELELIGLKVPLLRQIVCFFYLLFIPGFLILRILKLYNMSSTETLIYSLGLSIATIMFTGFFMNIFYPYVGISKPLSFFPLIVTLNVLVLSFCVLCYVRDKEFTTQNYIDVQDILSNKFLFLMLMPFLSIFGTYMVNYYKINSLLMLMLIGISITFLLCLYKYIPEKLYPFAIWTMSISLIWHTTLISQYINVGDVVIEYQSVISIIKNSYWNWSLPNNPNSILSIVILAPIFSKLFDLDLTWVFKIVYPFLFSFVPVGVYLLIVNQTKNDKLAFLSSFVFIEISPFFYQIPLIAKQSTAEIFVILLFIVILGKDSSIKNPTKNILSIIFAVSLIVSHYGTSYIIMFLLIFSLLFSYMINMKSVSKLWGVASQKLKIDSHVANDSIMKINFISLTFVILFIVFTISWYVYVSNSSSFKSLIHVIKNIVISIFTDYINPDTSRGLYMITRSESSFLRFVNKFLYIISQISIAIGFMYTIFYDTKLKFTSNYLLTSIYFLTLLFSAIIFSGFTVMMDPTRLYHLSLFILSPFCIIGFQLYKKIFQCSSGFCLKILSLFLILFFLFNTSFIYEVANDHPYSISIGQQAIRSSSDLEDKAKFYGGYIVTQNVFSGKWLGKNMNSDCLVYRGDSVEGYPSLTIYGGINPHQIHSFDNTTKEISKGYIQLSYANVVENVGSIWYNPLQKRTEYNFSEVNPIFDFKDKVYSNGGSDILIS